MAELPDELFLDSLARAVRDRQGVGARAGGEDALYLRPFMLATEVGLGVRPAAEYLYLLIASPVGPYFAGGVKPIDVWLSTDYTRAAPRRHGRRPSAAATTPRRCCRRREAVEHGCDQVVWLDAEERRWVEEMGGMNLFFVFGSGDQVEIVTPDADRHASSPASPATPCSRSPRAGLPGHRAADLDDEWRECAADGLITEVFACGTAAVITPVGSVKHADGEVVIGDGEPGPVTTRLRAMLTDIQRGAAPDTHSWMRTLVPA